MDNPQCSDCTTKQQIIDLDGDKPARFPEDFACPTVFGISCFPEYARCCPGYRVERSAN